MKNSIITDIKTRLRNFFILLVKSRLFMQNILYISGIMLLFFCIFAYMTYRQSSGILKSEFSSSSAHQLEITSDAVDAHLQNMRYIVATIDKNQTVQAFFSYINPETLYADYETQLCSLLESYSYSHVSIDSIYLYSELSASVITSQGRIAVSQIKDTNWLEYLTEDVMKEKLLIFPRVKNDSYPYLLCIMKPLEVKGHKAAIVLNLNLDMVPYLQNVNANPYQEIYMVSDDKQVIYSYSQHNLLEPLDTFPALSSLQETDDIRSTVISDTDEPHIMTQLHSKDYPWYYVTVTNLTAYNDRLSQNTAFMISLLSAFLGAVLIMSFLFSVRSTKPVHSLLLLLKSPDKEFYNKRNQNEVSYIAEQIISYAQQNSTLSNELTQRLNLLNETKLLALQSQINPHFLFNTLNMIYSLECEELGYKHKLPGLTLNLSRLLRYAFESTDLVPLSTELNFTKMYLSLMQQRHNDRFEIIYDIDPDTLNFMVPKLFIQPITENAIFHGLSGRNEDNNSCLQLSSRLQDGKCIITVFDNGAGMSTETLDILRNITEEHVLKSTGIGLKNVIIRMKLLYGDGFSMTIDSRKNEGSTFVLSIPPL